MSEKLLTAKLSLKQTNKQNIPCQFKFLKYRNLRLDLPKRQTTKLGLQNYKKKHTHFQFKLYNVDNSKRDTVGPEETSHYELSHLGLQCLQIQLLLLGTLCRRDKVCV